MVVTLNTMQPTSVAGKIGICYDPDSTDDMPADRTEFFATYKNIEGPVWQSISLVLPVSGKEYFTNSHTTTDSKLIDDGQFILMSDLLSSSSVSLADIVVTYEVELMDPQQALYSTQDLFFSNYTFTTAKYITDSAVAHGPHIAEVYSGTLTAMYLYAPPGVYLVNLLVYDSSNGNPTVTVHNGTSKPMFYKNIVSTANAYQGTYLVKFTSANLTNPPVGETLGFTFGTVTIANLEAIRFLITRISPTVYNSTGGLNTAAAGADVTP
jgi:hypothetical protein